MSECGQADEAEDGRRAEISEVENSGRRANRAAMGFALCMMLAALVLPFAYATKELGGWMTALQLALWAAFSGSWLYLGAMIDRLGEGILTDISIVPQRRRFGTPAEIAVFLLVFAPACFGYVYVAFQNTGYLGFNYVMMFVVAGFSTHIFPMWVVLPFLLLETAIWAGLVKAMWGGWIRIDDVITTISGFLFSAMMFFLLRGEGVSRRRAEALTRKLDAANEKLREYSAQVEELSAARERNRIAREIHDTLGHALTVVNMQLETARALIGADPEKAAAFVGKAQSMTRKGLADVRASVASLRASPLDGGLEVALRGLLEPIRSAGIDASFSVKGAPRRLGEQVEAALYRSVQEGLTNVRKHANASRVSLDLEFADGGVAVVLRDDGVGCEQASGGFGLLGIRERIQLLDGDARVETAPGRGFELAIRVGA